MFPFDPPERIRKKMGAMEINCLINNEVFILYIYIYDMCNQGTHGLKWTFIFRIIVWRQCGPFMRWIHVIIFVRLKLTMIIKIIT